MRSLRVSETVRRFQVDGGLLVLDAGTCRLFAFNDSARHVWDLITVGRSGEALVSEFAAWWEISASRARDDLSSILEQWRKLGLLDGGEAVAAPSQPASLAAAQSHALRQSPPDLTCTIRGKTIQFATPGNVTPTIRSLFRHLETPGAQPQTRFEIAAVDDGEWLLTENGIERIRTGDLGLLAGSLQQGVLELIHPDAVWLGLIHGAAVARHGRGFGLAGPSGSGKSTLAAGLLSAGFDYLSDDMIALSAPHGTIVPWPLPLSIKPGSLDVVTARHPELAHAPAYLTKGLDARLLIPPDVAWDREPVKLQTLVFPRFVVGATADLRRISTFEAIERLLVDRIWLGHPITEERVTSFLTWLHGIPAYAITYENLDDGVRLIEDISD
jgi:hypothetical protein